MILHAYFDEHGHDGSSVYAIAGYVGTDEQWSTFTEKWSSTLERHYAFGPFHMVEFEASDIDKKSQFHGWSKDQKDALAKELFPLIPDSGVRGLGQAILMDAFNGLSENAQQRLRDPYWVCFHNCIERLLKDIPEDDKVDLVFDRKDKYTGEALDRYRFLKDDWLPPAQAKKLVGCAFRDDDIIIPLQAADVLVYETGKLFENAFRRPDLSERKSLQVLRARQNVQIGVWDRDNLAAEFKKYNSLL